MAARKTIPAHRLTTFRLRITPALHGLLRRLDSRKALRIPFVARVDHVAGNVGTDRLTVHVPDSDSAGRKRAHRGQATGESGTIGIAMPRLAGQG